MIEVIGKVLVVLCLVEILCLNLSVEQDYYDDNDKGGADQSNEEDEKEDDPLMRRLLRNYNKYTSPHGENSTRVQLGTYVNSFYAVSETTMDYSINIYLRQSWNDPRLQFNSSMGNHTTIKLHDGMWRKLWTPDVFFRNEKRARFHYATTPNRLMRLGSDGTLFYVIKLTLVLDCQMCLKKFPMDKQSCPLYMESFGYTSATMYFEWLAKPVEMDGDVQLPQFNKIKNWTVENCTQAYLTGTYSCLRINFILARSFGYYLTQMYIPTMLIIVLSWVGFWISIDAVPARVTLGLLTVLTITTQRSTADSSLPRVSYIKALDVWMATCLVFVFASFLEFAVISFVSNRIVKPKPIRNSYYDLDHIPNMGGKGKKNSKNQGNHNLAFAKTKDPSLETSVEEISMNVTTTEDHAQTGTGSESKQVNSYSLATDDFLHRQKSRKEKELEEMMVQIQRRKAIKIDAISRWLFPLLFSIFNVSYWFTYLSQEDSKCD